jgi:acetyl-CoA C-acetyltransferase
MTRQRVAEKLGLAVVARVVAHSAHALEPARFTTAPVGALRKVLAKSGWTVDGIDLFEVNEAFAMVPMVAAKELGISMDKLNVNGGATALGHPVGASGARVIATLLSALSQRGLKRGVASLCIGGGEATAMALELV